MQTGAHRLGRNRSRAVQALAFFSELLLIGEDARIDEDLAGEMAVDPFDRCPRREMFRPSCRHHLQERMTKCRDLQQRAAQFRKLPEEAEHLVLIDDGRASSTPVDGHRWHVLPLRWSW